ncbi:MAG: FMN-binding protein, partial [Gemmatimonadota bacterium]
SGALTAPGALPAQTLLTQEEALELAFPAPTRVERRTAYLTDAELARARELAGDDVALEQGVITYYAGTRDGRPAGVAYFDAHRVRTKSEVVMVVVDRDARVRRVDVLKFTEPPEYRAPDAWIRQLHDRALGPSLAVGEAVGNLTGATLTARAMTRAVRRVLALHAVIRPFGEAP